MTGKPITWDEIEEIFGRCGEAHLSPNLAQAIEARSDETPKSGSARRAKARSRRDAS